MYGADDASCVARTICVMQHRYYLISNSRPPGGHIKARPELLMSRAANLMERDLKQERHAQNGPPTPGSKTQQNASQAQFSSIAEVLEDVLTGIGASTDDAGGLVRITGNDPYVASPHRLAAAATI